MKKHILLIILAFSAVGWLSAQENTPTNFYALNPQILNPAHTGQSDLGFYLNHRNQWYGLRDAPEYLNMGVHSSVAQNFCVGLNYNRYTSGIFVENTISPSASYMLKINDKNRLRFGASMGIMSNGVNMPDDGVSDASDISLNNYFEETLMKAGFGLSYDFNDIIQLDVSIPEVKSVRNDEYFQSVIAYATYKYKFTAGGIDMVISPAGMYRYNSYMLTTYEATLSFEISNVIWLIGGYRNTSGLLLGAGIRNDKFAFAYSYETDNSPMSAIAKGTHELTAYYNFEFKKK